MLARLAPAREPRPARPTARKAPGQAPDVSILVPYYNMGRWLPETLRSLQAQTFEDYEILLVDDGSTDPASQRLVDELEGTPKLRIVRKQNGGLSSARNAGLREARGRWILPVDPDDLLAPTFLEKTVDVMSRSPKLGYTTALVSYFTEDPRKPVGGWVPWGMERDALCLENVASTCTALMERELVEELGGYDEWLTSFEDWDVFCRHGGARLRGHGHPRVPLPLPPAPGLDDAHGGQPVASRADRLPRPEAPGAAAGGQQDAAHPARGDAAAAGAARPGAGRSPCATGWRTR